MISLTPRFDDVCAVIVTRGDNDQVVREIVRDLPYGEVIVADNSIDVDHKVMGRYIAAERTLRPVVYFQDDDVKLPQSAHDALLANYAPGILTSNMYDEWIESMGYFDLAMVGLGSIMDNGLWKEPFSRWKKAYPWAHEDHLALDPDFIFGVLAKWRRFDFGAKDSILPCASDDTRLWRQEGQHARKYLTISMARRLRKIVLTMMVKNESKNLPRALESSMDWWDHLLLLDTGSTDDTTEVAKRFCEVFGKKFTLAQAEFTNFAAARELLLQLGRSRGDYMLLQDADEEWVWDLAPNRERPELWAEAYMLHYEGSVDYAQPRLIASRHPWKWTGAVHAYLDSDWEGETLAVNMQWPLIVHHGDERSATNHGERDVEILCAEIGKGNDLHRNFFLLGKCLDGLKRFDEALEAYEARIALGSLDEEDYWCRLRRGVLTCEHLNDFKTGIDLLWEAFQTRPHRAEALRAISFYTTAVADALPYPEDDITLVLRNSYRV